MEQIRRELEKTKNEIIAGKCTISHLSINFYDFFIAVKLELQKR